MTQHAVRYAPSRSTLSAPQATRVAPDSDSTLLKGVAAQDALVALFDEFEDEEPPKMSAGVIRLFRRNVARDR